MEGKEQVNTYCEEYATKLVANEPKVWILSSKAYLKRYNLNQDSSCWQGWEVQMRTPKKDILVILLRRKYIPPLLDYFVDFIIGIECYEKRTNSKQLSTKGPFDKNYITINHARNVADSIHASFTTTTIYETFIEKRVNSLHYDEETLNYIQLRFQKRLKFMHTLYGVSFIQSIVNLLFKDQKGLLILSKLKEKYQEEAEDFYEDWDFCLKASSDKPAVTWDAVRTALENKIVRYRKKVGEKPNENWSFKVSKYLAYCVDGGLTSFTLSMMIERYLTQAETEIGAEANKIIQYLLHFKTEKDTYKSVPFGTKLQEMLYSKENYIYNEKVMITLLGIGYFKKELSSNSSHYSKFLIHMLENSTNRYVKSAICQQIIEDQNEKKGATNNADVNSQEVKGLARSLLSFYQGQDFRLSTLAAIALSNICSKEREIKQFIIKEGDDIIVQHLDSKDEDLLLHTLQLLEYLMLVPQNVQTFLAKDVFNKILSILRGSGIAGVVYSDILLTIACQIFYLIVSNADSYKAYDEEETDVIMNLFELGRIEPISDILVAEILNLLLYRLADNETRAIEDIGQKCLEKILKKFKGKVFRTKDLKSKILSFFLCFKNSENMMSIIKDAEIVEDIKELGPEHGQKANKLLKEIRVGDDDMNENDDNDIS